MFSEMDCHEPGWLAARNFETYAPAHYYSTTMIVSNFETSEPEGDISHPIPYPPMSFEVTLMPTKLHT